MRNRLTALEIAEADHPGILTLAKQGLDHGKSSAFVAQVLNRRFHLSLTKSTVEKYRSKRWQVHRDALQQQKDDFAELATEIKERDLNNAAKALLFQSVKKLDPQALLGILRLNVQRDVLRTKKKALRLQNPEGQRKELTPEETDALCHSAATTMRSIFGLKEKPNERPWPSGPFLFTDQQGKGQLYVASNDTNELTETLLRCAHAQLCKPEGFHGRTYEGPEKPRAIARLKDLFALQHLPWPEDTEQSPTVPKA